MPVPSAVFWSFQIAAGFPDFFVTPDFLFHLPVLSGVVVKPVAALSSSPPT